MTIHTIQPERSTLHGHFSRDLKPVVTIDPGDTVRMETLDARWFTQFTSSLEHPPQSMEEVGIQFEPRSLPEDAGHALCGPIAIRGAKPGMMVAIHFNRIVPGEWGWTFPWFGTSMEEKDPLPVTLWQLDADAMTGRNQHGHTVGLRPFMGVVGMPSDSPGLQPTAPPGLQGGNLDCKELVAGSTLYLPLAVEGGLLSLGDGHAAQGDGESAGTAIECPMHLVDITLELIDSPVIDTLYAKTPSGWITLGVDEDLQKAHDMALGAMQKFVAARYDVNLHDALSLISVVVDMHITQTVNGVKGVHAILPHGALR